MFMIPSREHGFDSCVPDLQLKSGTTVLARKMGSGDFETQSVPDHRRKPTPKNERTRKEAPQKCLPTEEHSYQIT